MTRTALRALPGHLPPWWPGPTPDVYHEVHVFEAIGAVGRQGWHPQDLANVAWAFAVVAVPVPMAEVAVESLRKLPDFRQEEVEMLLWALAPSQLDMAMEILKATDQLGLLRPLGHLYSTLANLPEVCPAFG